MREVWPSYLAIYIRYLNQTDLLTKIKWWHILMLWLLEFPLFCDGVQCSSGLLRRSYTIGGTSWPSSIYGVSLSFPQRYVLGWEIRIRLLDFGMREPFVGGTGHLYVVWLAEVPLQVSLRCPMVPSTIGHPVFHLPSSVVLSHWNYIVIRHITNKNNRADLLIFIHKHWKIWLSPGTKFYKTFIRRNLKQ